MNDKFHAIMNAMAEDNLAKFEELLTGIDLTERDEAGYTLLGRAVCLIQHSYTENGIRYHERTVPKIKIQYLEKLIAAGSDVNTIVDNQSILLVAMRKDNMEAVELLVRNGADINRLIGGCPEFFLFLGAYVAGESDIKNIAHSINRFIELGLDVHVKPFSINAMSLIMVYNAMCDEHNKNKFFEVLQCLLGLGVQNELKDLEVLYPQFPSQIRDSIDLETLKKSRQEITSFISYIQTEEEYNQIASDIKTGKSIVTHTKNEFPMILHAIKANDTGVFYALLENTLSNESLLRQAIKSAKDFNENHLNILLARPEVAKLQFSDEQGNTLMHIVAVSNNLTLVEEFLKSGANIDALNNEFSSPADTILFNNNENNFVNATKIIGTYSKDPVYKALHAQTHNVSLENIIGIDSQKTYIAIPTSGGFWSNKWFSVARSIMQQNENVEAVVLAPDQVSETVLKEFDGIILQGGGDNYPKKPEFTIQDFNTSTMIKIEKLYQSTLSISDKYSIPTIGICAGNQHITLFNNGTLNPLKNYNDGEHKGYFIQGGLPHFMALNTLEKGAVLNGETMDQVSAPIITAHNYAAVDGKLGGLKAGVYSEEGVVQSVYKGTNFIGYQFHPEDVYLRKSSTQQVETAKNIINSFVALSKQHSQYESFAQDHNISNEDAMKAMTIANAGILNQLEKNAATNGKSDYETYIGLVESTTCQAHKAGITEFSWPQPSVAEFCEVLGVLCESEL